MSGWSTAAGWIGRYSLTDRSMAPDGEDLIQAQMGQAPGHVVDR
jgi:hypothetical protein